MTTSPSKPTVFLVIGRDLEGFNYTERAYWTRRAAERRRDFLANEEDSLEWYYVSEVFVED